MTEKKAPRTNIVPSDIDGQGNVVLWDHGPLPARDVPRETEEAKAERVRRHEEDARVWHENNGDGPLPIPMHSSDASHAMMIEPERYALEPHDIDEDEIAKRVADKKAKREAARDFAQNAIDRREAISEMMSDRAQARLVDETEETDHRVVGMDFGRPSETKETI